jgi:hypothetical protein
MSIQPMTKTASNLLTRVVADEDGVTFSPRQAKAAADLVERGFCRCCKDEPRLFALPAGKFVATGKC